MAKHQFQTEANQILNLMIHSLYSNKEIFIRELISNASDALDKLNMLVLTDDAYKGITFSPRIDIVANKEAKTLTIKDSGIGMDEEDLMNNLGTIAKSGTKAFLEKMTGDQKKDSNLIGQFGVGFYSCFMVAHSVEVITKKAGEEQAYLWKSNGDGEFEIEKTTRDSHGTTIIMHLNDDDAEFLDAYRIENIIKKYSNRKLYDTKEKKYVNLSEISRLIREGAEVKVIDNETKEDITSLTLAQIIVEQEKTKKIMLPSILSPLKILIKKGGEDMLNLSKKMFLAGIGTLSLTKEKAIKIADDLIKRGELSQSESKEFVVNLLDKAEKEKDKLLEKIKPDIEKSIEKMNFASKKCVDDLEKKIDELGNKIDQLSKKIR